MRGLWAAMIMELISQLSERCQNLFWDYIQIIHIIT